MAPVHPHACGEHMMIGIRFIPSIRFIPTHVGNTPFVLLVSSGITVHPHACGEHPAATRSNRSKRGSSPRMWGTPDMQRRMCIWYRFIPTHVGNTSSKQMRGIWDPVHPHACGEHLKPMNDATQPFGSSPRMWGTLQV